ncbi:hypothetical protein PG991_013311 [Apiospora marii]|uniref:Uncharacterized protein n=1 Tax=Apiospora marii TaxID=335849 RepID=A0ABR1R5N5_9PEZI
MNSFSWCHLNERPLHENHLRNCAPSYRIPSYCQSKQLHSLDILIAQSQSLGGIQMLDPHIHQAHEPILLRGLGPGLILWSLGDEQILVVRILFDHHAATFLALAGVIVGVVCDDLLGAASGLTGLLGLLSLLLLLIDRTFFLVLGLVDEQAARSGEDVEQDGDRGPVKFAQVWTVVVGQVQGLLLLLLFLLLLGGRRLGRQSATRNAVLSDGLQDSVVVGRLGRLVLHHEVRLWRVLASGRQAADE